jgi:hypothetical protein
LQSKLARIAKMRRRRARRRRLGIAVIAASTLGAWPLAFSLAATAPPQNTPGSLTGWAFDACAAPSAHTMDAWLKDKTNPYRGIGIYISGSLRACSQPNLTTSWVNHVQATGWHLLPLTVGPQASCTGFSQVINSRPTNTYAAARKQGAAQADDAVANAKAMGINPGSTLFYDMENWHTGYTNCDASTLWFLSAWSNRLHAYGYAGGTYVSGQSGARLLNAMANNKPSGFVLPDQIWIAEWNNQENVRSNYVDSQNWANHQRAHQYYGGHNATNSGITLNIDSNYVDLRPVSPIPAVLPDSAIGAVPTPKPSASPTPVTPTATPSKPAATPTSVRPAATAKPTVAPSSTAKPSPTPTKSTSVSKPATTPKATPSPTAAVHPTATAKPTATATTNGPTAPSPSSTHTRSTLSGTVKKATDDLGTATGIKLPTHADAKALAPKFAQRVPAMEAPQAVTKVTPQATTPKVAKPTAASTTASPEPNAANPNNAQAAPLQPSLPVPLPPAASEPAMIAQIWHTTQGVLATIGHAIAGAAGWVSRGFGSMLGW